MTPAVTLQVQDSNGNLLPSASNAITLALATNPGGSTLGGTVTVYAVNGVATFSTLLLNKVGTGYTLSASAVGLTGATSTAFNITPGPAAQLAFQTQPCTTVAGSIMTPAVTVLVQDANGNLAPTATNAITPVLAMNPGGSTLGGNWTVNAVNGVATFSTLTLDKIGNGYTLSASATGLISATSIPFAVTATLPACTITTSASPAITVPGGLVTYTLAYHNTGNVALSNVMLSDTLPAAVSYVAGSASGNGSYAAASNTLNWSPGTLSAGSTGQMTFQVTVATTATVGSTISNTAQITCASMSYPVTSNSAIVSVMAPLSTVALTTSPVSPQSLNTPIILQASATGGLQVQYQFWVYNSMTMPPWSELQAYSALATCVWSPLTAGNYLLSLTAQDNATGTTANTMAWYTVTPPPLKAVSVTASPTAPQLVNTPITLSATATGGTNVQFQFWVFNAAATPAWSQLQGYSSSATCVWTPATAANYLLSVTASDTVYGSTANTLVWYQINPPR